MDTNIDIKLTLSLHAKWLKGEEGGKRANLQRASLQGANLQDADLRCADLQDANLQRASLQGANLQDANLQDANLDRSSGLPLWCGAKGIIIPLLHIYQYFAHFCTFRTIEEEREEFERIKAFMLPYAKKSHRAKTLGVDRMEMPTAKPGNDGNGKIMADQIIESFFAFEPGPFSESEREAAKKAIRFALEEVEPFIGTRMTRTIPRANFSEDKHDQ